MKHISISSQSSIFIKRVAYLLLSLALILSPLIGLRPTIAAPAGTALSFDGTNDYVTFGLAAGLGTQTFTIEARVKRAAGGKLMGTGTAGLGDAGLPQAYPVITKGRGQAETPLNVNMNYWVGIASTGVVAADFEDSNDGLNHPILGMTVIPVGEWHHIAVTYAAGCWNVFVDGNLDALNNATTQCPKIRNSTTISAIPESTSIQHSAVSTTLQSLGTLPADSGYFSGVIDEARIWNRALLQSEIQTNRYSELTSGAGLLARWGMNESSGISTNSSVGTFPGTLTNGPTWVIGFPDNTIPSAPTGLSATAGNKLVNLIWIANSESDLAGYNLYRSAAMGGPYTKVNTPLIIGTSYSDTNLTSGTPYYYVLRAVDTSTNESGNSSEVTATPTEINTALQFTTASGTYVTFGDPTKLDLTTFTIETWFKRTGAGTTNTTGTGGITSAIPLVTHGSPQGDGSNVDADWVLVINDTTKVIGADFEDMATGLNHPVSGVTPIVNDVWYHAAATYDGTTWRLYLNGNLETTLVVGAFTPRSDSIQQAGLGTMIESGGMPHGYFQGVIDEARVWNVARSQSQIRADINSQLTSGTGLVARWGLNDGTGTVVGDSIATAANGTITGANYAWVAPGAPFDIVFDTTPPAAPTALTATPGSGSVGLSWTAPADPDVAGYNIYRGIAPGVPLTSPINGGTLVVGTSYADGGRTNGTTYYYVVTAVDTSANQSVASNEVNATPLANLGSGLQFDGTNDYVTFGTATGLGATNFTLETWFYWTGGGVATTTSGTQGLPSVIPLVSKGRGEADGSNLDMNYFLGIDTNTGALAADFEDMATGMNYPVIAVTPVTLNTWHHAAVTYDSVTGVWSLYLDGNLDRTLDVGNNVVPRYDSIQHAGLATAMTSNGTAAGYFQGRLDEARVWNVVRTQAEIRSTINSELTSSTGLIGRWSMNEGSGTTINSSVGTFPGTLTNGPTWVTGAPFNLVFDTTPPAAPTTLMASPRPGAVQLEWTANTELDLAGYRVYRSTSSPVVKGTSINGTLMAPSFMDTTVTEGITYYYAVTAVDTSNNESDLSSETSAVPLPPPPAEALDFGSGNAYVTFGDPAALDLAQFTIETWFKRTGAGTSSTTGTSGVTSAIPLVTHGSPEADGSNVDANWVLVIDDTNDVIAADFEDMATGLNHPVYGTTPIVNDVWYHAAATFDGTTWRLYLNGNLETSLAVSAVPRSDSIQRAGLGTMIESDGTTNGHFQGVLDEARVWNVARTQTDIISTINAKITTPQTGLVGRWGLDEASGSTANDSSGNAINGTITGTDYSWVPGSPFNATINLPPGAPQLIGPANNATNVAVPTTLSVNVSDPENHALDVTFYGRPLQAAAGPDFTLVVIPDAQYYAATYPAIYNAQMNWVVNNRTSNNIVYVASLGDNVDVASNLTQWTNADAAYDILDAANVPYGLAAGNHDGAPSGTGNFNTNFGVARFTGKPYYGGHYGSDNDNHYALFSASGLNFIVVFIEYDDAMTATNHPVLQWANDLLQTHSDRRAIVISHNMLQGGTSTSFSTQGQTIYNALRGNANLFLIMGGHLDVASRRTDVYNGNTVYTLRSDYQSVDSQQSGYLRIMRFSPADDMIYIRTYSPTQNKDYDKSDAAQSNFNLSYVMDGVGFQVIGTATGVASGGTASISWSGLDPNAQYEWFAIASDGTHQTSSTTWNFTTASTNTAPVAANDSYDVAEDSTLTVSTPGVLTNDTDADSNPLTAVPVTGPTHGSLTLNSDGSFTYTPALNYTGPDKLYL